MRKHLPAVFTYLAITLAVIALVIVIGMFSKQDPTAAPDAESPAISRIFDGFGQSGEDNAGSPEPSALPAEGSSPIDAHGVPFPDGSLDHDFFTLDGAHAQIACEACHASTSPDGTVVYVYAGTPTECTACHLEEKPVDHYDAECSFCHIPTAWTDVIFDHAAAGATDCQSCHSDDEPADHFAGQCSDCHTTGTWAGATFNHTGQTNCTSCHSDDDPPNHYTGQCSNCHNTSNWADADFDHTGLTNCSSCHTPPSGHFSGQCSNCHNTSNWNDADFNHDEQTNCSSCHTPPNNHYSGQCSNCHQNDDDWKFDHISNNLNCLTCHTDDMPNDEDHPEVQQCSNCHNTSNWGDADDGADINTATIVLSNCVICHSGESSMALVGDQ